MGEIQFNHKEALANAYGALQTLRAEGYAIPPLTMLEKRSGVRRSTFYTTHPDWIHFREVVKKELPIKQLAEAGAALEEKAEWVRRFGAVQERTTKIQEDIKSIKNSVDVILTRLADELHKYVLRSKETPRQSQARAELLKQNANFRQEVQRLKNEIAELMHATSLPADIRPLAKKEVITIDDGLSGVTVVDSDFPDRAVDVANSLDDFFAASHGAQIPAIVYLLCGNFASGKSRWISEHNPLVPGVNLYLDGTNHTAHTRRIFIKRIRKLSPACTIVCVRLFTTLDLCLKRNGNPSRDRTKKVLPDELLTRISNNFEEVSIDEDFDQILLVKNR